MEDFHSSGGCSDFQMDWKRVIRVLVDLLVLCPGGGFVVFSAGDCFFDLISCEFRPC